AREEPAVSNRTDRNFGNTILFLLADELGHALKKHNTHSRDPVQKRKQEIEADQFAIEVMRRIGQMPLGIEFWFDVEHFRHVAPTKVPTEAEWQKHLAALDHPVTTDDWRPSPSRSKKLQIHSLATRLTRRCGLNVRKCWRRLFAGWRHLPIRSRTWPSIHA